MHACVGKYRKYGKYGTRSLWEPVPYFHFNTCPSAVTNVLHYGFFIYYSKNSIEDKGRYYLNSEDFQIKTVF